MINLHPPATALPFAFILLLLVLEVIYLFRGKKRSRDFCDLVLIAYLVGLVLAFFSGYHGIEFADLDNPDIAKATSDHHTLGKILLFTSLPMFVFGILFSRASRRQTTLRIAYYIFFIVALTLTLWVGYLGGELVFSHGAGVSGLSPGVP